MDEKIAVRVISKYLKKGNMARCLRDILPSAGLSMKQREEIADIVHAVVRWKKLYDHIIHGQGMNNSAESYLRLALDQAETKASGYPFKYRYSCSPFVATLFKNHEHWAKYLNETPPTTLCVNFNKCTLDDAIKILKQEKLPVERSILKTTLQTTSTSKYSKVIQHHYAHVQDESSQLISYVSASLGTSIFDFCAGNGGKTLAIASLTKNQKQLYAYELNTFKRKTLKQRCEEYGANVIIQEEHSLEKKYDVVLVDAPCTGLGAARRNPEAKYIQNVGALPQTQLSLLNQVARNVKQGCILFYVVCTITPEETTQVIQTFLKRNTFTVYPYENLPYKELLQKKSHGVFTTIPNGDLFFISVLKKEP